MKFKMRLSRRTVGILQFMLFSGLLFVGYTNCSSKFDSTGASANLDSSIASVPQIQLNLQVYDASSKLIYDDSNPNTKFNVNAAQAYTFKLNALNAPAGLDLVLKFTNTSVIKGAQQSLPLVVGNNIIADTTFAPGYYSMQLTAVAPSMLPVSKSYTANMICQAASVAPNLSGVAVSVSGPNNLYSFGISGVPAGASGASRSSQCGLDPTGNGILDTGFHDCGQAFSGIYSNFVGARNLDVVVLDACNNPFVVAAAVVVPSTPVSMPGNVFIAGQTSAAVGTAVGDSRVNNVNYLATNAKPNKVIPQYAIAKPGGTGAFTIRSTQNYGMGSSVSFGVSLSIANIIETVPVDLVAGTGSLDVSQAKMTSMTYSTDQNGDVASARTFSKGVCTYTPGGAKVIPVVGNPCLTTGKTSPFKYTVEVWGSFVCTGLSDAGGSMTFSGDFDGYNNLADSCTGGGGGGGGVPITGV